MTKLEVKQLNFIGNLRLKIVETELEIKVLKNMLEEMTSKEICDYTNHKYSWANGKIKSLTGKLNDFNEILNDFLQLQNMEEEGIE